MSIADAPTTDLDLAEVAASEDPYPAMHAIRELGPAVYHPGIDRWLVASYEHARKVLGDQVHFPQDADYFFDFFHAPTLESEADPRHREIRSAYNPRLTRDAVEQLKPRILELIDERLEVITQQLDKGEVVDMIPTMTGTLPPTVIAELMGVPITDLPQFKVWAHNMCKSGESVTEQDEARRKALREDSYQAVREVCAYAQTQLDERRASGNDRDWTGVFALSPVAQTMTAEEQQAAIALLIVAGDDNTQKLLNFAIIALARHPEARREIAEDRSLLPKAVQEIVRWTGPSFADPRLAGEDADIGGIPIPEGDHILVLDGIANRDPARWESPDTFDIHRPYQSNLGFGFGTHICAGMNLARVETELMLGRMLDEMPDYRLADERIEYGRMFIVRGPTAVRVTL